MEDIKNAPPIHPPYGPAAPQNPPVNPMPFVSQPIAPVQPSVISQQSTATVPPLIPPPPKKSFPKVFIYVGIAVLILILGFVVFRMFSGKTTTASEITWWGLWEDDKVVSALISEYEVAHPKVKINYIKQSPIDYRERLTNTNT